MDSWLTSLTLARQVVVTGMSAVSALGASLDATWHHLLLGHCGIKRHALFADHSDLLLGMIGQHPSSIEALLEQSLPDVLEDAQLSQVPPQTAVVIGSSRGNQAQIEAIARKEQDLASWLDTFQASPSQIIARQLHTHGPVLAPRAACATALWAIAQAADLIRWGCADMAIAGGVEAPITPLTVAGFQKMGALSSKGCTPFDHQRSGFVLGEGSALFVLESLESAQQRQTKIYGHILGFGTSTDAYHLSAPNPNPHSAIMAIKQSLRHSQLKPQDIQFIHTHGTGTQLNDSNEARLIQHLFPHRPPCTSSKGAIGHTLGASGAMGTAICLLSMQSQLIPNCVGLNNLDPQCPINVIQSTQPCNIQQALCLSFGFGGQNAALVFQRS